MLFLKQCYFSQPMMLFYKDTKANYLQHYNKYNALRCAPAGKQTIRKIRHSDEGTVDHHCNDAHQFQGMLYNNHTHLHTLTVFASVSSTNPLCSAHGTATSATYRVSRLLKVTDSSHRQSHTSQHLPSTPLQFSETGF